MISLKDINESDEGLKGLFILLIMMPFWYSYFGLFFPEILEQSDIILLCCYCFCLSLGFGSFYLISVLTLLNFKKKVEQPNEIVSCILSVCLQVFIMINLMTLTNLINEQENIHLSFTESLIIFSIPFFLIFIVDKLWKLVRNKF